MLLRQFTMKMTQEVEWKRKVTGIEIAIKFKDEK